MLSDYHAALIGLDGIFDKEKKQTALKSLYKYNFKKSMRSFANMWRNFSLNDEGGTVICAYPEGVKKPSIPIPYCEETMTGFEYSLAALMLANGMEREACELVTAIRDRYDGEKRNPFNKIECGSNYARSMASFSLLPIYSGFSYDMTKNYIGFDPISKEKTTFIWSILSSWGTVETDASYQKLSVFEKPLSLSSFGVPNEKSVKSLAIDGKRVPFHQENDRIFFEQKDVCHTLLIEY